MWKTTGVLNTKNKHLDCASLYKSIPTFGENDTRNIKPTKFWKTLP